MIKPNLYLDSRRSKDGLADLKFSISNNGTRAYIPLNISLPKNCWDDKQKIAIKGYKHLNPSIKNKFGVIENNLFNLSLEKDLKNKTAIEIKTLLEKRIFESPDAEEEPDDRVYFISRFTDFMNRHSEGTKRIYQQTLNRLESYLDKKTRETLTFEDVNLKWLRDFENFLSKTESKNTRNIHLRNIRAVFNDALDDELITCYPFRKFKIRPEATRKRSIGVEDLRTLFQMKVAKDEELFRDMFKLIFMLIGINTVDLYRLDTITLGRVEYKRAKTHRLYSIKVEPEALELIERYKGSRGLTLIADRWVDHTSFRNHFNKRLRKIGAPRTGLGGKKGEGMFPQITSYWARHSWATVAASLDIPKETIAAALGHGGNTVTDIYIDFDQRKVDEANRKVLDWVLYEKK